MKPARPQEFELDDCGREFHLLFGHRMADVTVIMVVKAPRGTMVLFDKAHWGSPSPDRQCEAIRAFVEEHRNDHT